MATTLALGGERLIELKVIGADTVTCAAALMPFKVAVTVTAPVLTPVMRPDALTVAMVGLLDTQPADVVTLAVDPSL